MRVAVSACLVGQKCRYDGNHCKRDILDTFLKEHEIIPVCPECLAGFSIPREPIEILDGKVIIRSGKDVTSSLEKGVEKALSILKENKIEIVILKSRSPSCGVGFTYDGTFSGCLIQQDGIFARALKKNGFFILQVD